MDNFLDFTGMRMGVNRFDIQTMMMKIDDDPSGVIARLDRSLKHLEGC